MQNNLKRSKHLGKYVSSAVLLIVCLLLLFPLIWGVMMLRRIVFFMLRKS